MYKSGDVVKLIYPVDVFSLKNGVEEKRFTLEVGTKGIIDKVTFKDKEKYLDVTLESSLCLTDIHSANWEKIYEEKR